MRLAALATFFAAIFGAVAALGELPAWIRNIDASTVLEGVFFRMMSLPNGAVAFRRPPSETRPALADLIKSQPHNAELYSLRAMEDEQQLDFTAAEADWKAYADNSSGKISAQLALADFYHRRLRPADEIQALALVAKAAPVAVEKLTAPAQQQSWQAFERIFAMIQAQGLAKDASIAQYRAWIARYPDEPSLYARFLQFLVAEREYPAAGDLIASYHKQFPNDQIFPVKAKAMVEYRRSSVRDGLSVYEQSFQPLWDPQLIKSYFDLLRDTQNVRKFRDDAHAALLANPEDLNATARTFYYYQQQGKTDIAQQAIADFRLHKEAAKSLWTSQELYVCARLLEDIHSYPESARYYFALYNSNGMPDAQEKAIGGLTSLLLTAPETPIRLGSGEISVKSSVPCPISTVRAPQNCWLCWIASFRTPLSGLHCTHNCSITTPPLVRATPSFRADANSSRVFPMPRNARPSRYSWPMPTRAKATRRANLPSTIPSSRKSPPKRRTFRSDQPKEPGIPPITTLRPRLTRTR